MGGVPNIRLYDNTAVAIVTRFDEVRQLVTSSDVSSDGMRPGFPFMSEASRVNRGGPSSIDRLDPPEHDEQRAMLAGFFSVKRIRALRPFIEETVDRLLDQFADGKTSGNFVAEFAEPIPALAIAKILDLPIDDLPFFFDRVKTWMDEKSDPEDIKCAMDDINDYFERVISERAHGLGEDVLSNLIRNQVDTGNLSMDQLLLAMKLFIKAGFDTSANMIALGTIVLLQHRSQWDELVNDENGDLTAGAVEELMRYVSVAHHSLMRMTIDPVPVGHEVIPAGTGVMASIMAANHDPEAWPNPDILDIHRDARGHVAFGIGLHQCLGQALARLELQVVFERLPKRFPNLQLDVEHAADLPFRDSVVFGVDAMPVRW